MDDDLARRLANLNAANTRALIRCAAMQTENAARAAAGAAPAYTEQNFYNLIDEEGLGYNTVAEATRP